MENGENDRDRERLVQKIVTGFEQIRSGQFTEYGPDSVPQFVASIRSKNDEMTKTRRAKGGDASTRSP